jgi:general secretion pathway protein G
MWNRGIMLEKNSAFTLLEIMIVVVIIGILAAMVFPRLTGRHEQAKRWKTVLQIRELQQALEDYYSDNGFYPTQIQGLNILVEKPQRNENMTNWRSGGYLNRKDIPLDSWNNHYQYLFPGLEGERYSIVSFGKDGKSGGTSWDRDIVSWGLETEIK